MDRSAEVITDKSAEAITATASGSAWLVERYTEAQAVVYVTAASGTNQTLDVTVETSPTDSGPWATHSTFTQITASATLAVLKQLTTIGKYLRFKYTIGGTGSPSFTVTSYFVVKN